MSDFPTPPPAVPPPNGGTLWGGFGIAALINLAGLVMGFITIGIGLGILVLVAFGLVQFAWLGPLYYSFRKQGKTETAKGVMIAAGISFLLNAGCWGLIALPGNWRH